MKNQPDKASTPGSAGLRTRQGRLVAPAEPRAPKGWRSRGYMPHLDLQDKLQHVTFHLADSLPGDALLRLTEEIKDLEPRQQAIEKRRRLEALVDAGHGACWLRRADCAQVVQDSLLHFDGQRYRMLAWVVMPNHVHALFQTLDNWSMNVVVGGWKTYTANAIGRLVRKPGEPVPHVWHPEFWDRYIRDERHLLNAINYIHGNPVKAGLVTEAVQWRWSSAHPDNAPREALPEKAAAENHDQPLDASAEPRDPGGPS